MSINDITGDKIATKAVTETFRSNFGSIDWSKKAGSAPAASAIKTCIKCPRDTDMRCGYCGLRQADGSVKTIAGTLQEMAK